MPSYVRRAPSYVVAVRWLVRRTNVRRRTKVCTCDVPTKVRIKVHTFVSTSSYVRTYVIRRTYNVSTNVCRTYVVSRRTSYCYRTYLLRRTFVRTSSVVQCRTPYNFRMYVRNTFLRTAYVHSYVFVRAYVRSFVRRRTYVQRRTRSSYVRRTFACCRTFVRRMYFDVVRTSSYVCTTSTFVVRTSSVVLHNYVVRCTLVPTSYVRSPTQYVVHSRPSWCVLTSSYVLR